MEEEIKCEFSSFYVCRMLRSSALLPARLPLWPPSRVGAPSPPLLASPQPPHTAAAPSRGNNDGGAGDVGGSLRPVISPEHTQLRSPTLTLTTRPPATYLTLNGLAQLLRAVLRGPSQRSQSY